MSAPVTHLPRLVVAAPASGHGKTMVATGLMAALRAAGHEVSPHKVGPDYIDPGYHELAAARPGRNLDPHLQGEDRIVPLLLHGASSPRPADVAVIEGVMGLFDGATGTGGFSSTDLNVNTVDLSTKAGATSAITAIDSAIKAVSTSRANLGALQNRFEHTINNLSVTQENLSASESRIRDTDMASEMMNFTRSQILSQAGTAMLAQANQAPQGVLSLLRG